MKVIAVVKDLFFAARFRETARLAGTDLSFARSPEELPALLAGGTPDLVIVDLTTRGWDYDGLFSSLERQAPATPVLGFTTHVLARDTQPLHGRCRRVLTKETLTRELGRILTEGLAA